MKLWKEGRVYLDLDEDKDEILEKRRMLVNPESKISHMSIFFFNESGNDVQTYFTERVSLELRLRLGNVRGSARLSECFVGLPHSAFQLS